MSNAQRKAADELAAEILEHREDVDPTAFWHRYRMEQHIGVGEPSFPHTLHLCFTIATAGLWAPLVWWPCYLVSRQRRYRKVRRVALQAHGLL